MLSHGKGYSSFTDAQIVKPESWQGDGERVGETPPPIYSAGIRLCRGIRLCPHQGQLQSLASVAVKPVPVRLLVGS